MQLIRKYWLGVLLLLLVAAAGAMIYLKLHPKELPSNLVAGTGHFDGDLLNLNTKYPGRLALLALDDGTPVHRGQILARLHSAEFEAQRDALSRQIAAKEALLKAKEIDVEIAQTTIPQALAKAQAALAAKEEELDALQKKIDAQQSVVEQSQRDYRRSENLYRRKLIQQELLEKARLKYQVDRRTLQALLDQKAQLLQAIRIARSDLADAQAGQKKLDALRQDLEALRQGVAALRAQRRQVDAMIAEMTLHSPFDGFCVERIANVGEVVGAGMPVATLIDPHSLSLKIFVDTLQNGKIALHDKGVIFLDAVPDHPIPAEVVRIASKAEFTPKEVNVRSDRIQRVFAVHLKPLHPDPLLKLGLPAVGVITLDGRGLPHSLDELPPL
ncbi:HlyD family secretion protein [Nitratifractor sp.]